MNLDLIRARNRKLIANNLDVEDSTNDQMPFFLPVIETVKGLAWFDQDEIKKSNDLPSDKQDDDLTGKSKLDRKRRRKRSGLLDQRGREDGLYAIEPVPGLSIKLKMAKNLDDCEFMT